MQLLRLGIICEGRSLWADSRDKFQEKYVSPALPSLSFSVKSTPCSQHTTPRRLASARILPMAASRLPGRALMRKISKRRSSSNQAASLNCEKWSGCRYYRAIGNPAHRGCVFDPPLRENIRKGANIEESVLVIRSGNRGV